MYKSHRSKDPLSQKVAAATHGQQVDLTHIPTFFEPFHDYTQEIAELYGRWNYYYPLFQHQDSAPLGIGTTEPSRVPPPWWLDRLANAGIEVGPTDPPPLGPGPQARLTSGLPVVSELPGLRVKRCVDTLRVSWWLKWDRDSDLLQILELMKKLVQDTEKDCIPVFKEHGFDWNLYRTGTRYYTFRLKSGDVTLLFNRRKEDGKIPNCRLEIGSLSCWSPGFYAIYNKVKTFLALHGGEVAKERVSEVHLAADFVGTDIKTTGMEDRSTWIALARKDGDHDDLPVWKQEPDPESLPFDRHFTNRKFSGLNIGKGDLMLRVYDKVLELKESRATHKQQVFSEIWETSSYDEQPVTRIEFQLRRPRLREFADVSQVEPLVDGKRMYNVADLKGKQIDTVFDLVNCMKSLWAYLTTQWTRHTSMTVNRNHNQTKARVSEFWEKVQAVVWTGVFGYVRIHPVKHKDIEMLRKQARGILMSVCAAFEIEPDDIDKIVYLCQGMIEEDLHRFFEDEKAFVDKMTTKRNEFRLTLAG
ncbi:MAG: hypothetical protein AB7F61_19175 [Desulfobulbus sp.]